jgi:DNA-binding response OmpR family regulator
MYALVIAEDPDETAILTLVLQRAGLASTVAGSLEQALRTWGGRPADMILCAVAEPGLMEQVQRIRAQTGVPLILITNPIDEHLHCRLLEEGADRVVMRPYSARLMIARVRALLRRAGGLPVFSLPTLSIAGLTLDPATRTVEVAGRPPRRLTHLEFRLLHLLMIHHGQVLPTEHIVRMVWGYQSEADPELVRGLVSRLRSKVEADPRNPRYILTVAGVGYRFGENP